MPPIPLELIILTLLFVVLPSITTIFYRLALHRHLINLEEKVRRLINRQPSGQQPKIVDKLQERFKEASSNLDQVNTAALIDQIYSQEKVGGFTCEQIDYFCRILPNLLLAFGLLGTFFGITINLGTLSQTINQTNSTNVSGLLAELKKPLEGMSIAFITSLTGLFFSTVLTLFNWLKNTSFAKYRLISSLEDYLDNIYHPKVQGDTRLDKIVNKMVSQQDQFLTRFGSTMRQAIEEPMKSVVKEMKQGNEEARHLATQVYERFYEAAGTISAAANEFKHTIDELNKKSDVFKQSAEIFAKSQFPQKLSAATGDLATIQERFSQSAASLAETTKFIQQAVVEVQRCSGELTALGLDIKNSNQTAIQVLELHQNNQNSLGEIIPQLKQGANSFSRAINKLDKLEKEIVSKSETFTKLVELVKNHTEQTNLAVETLGDRLILNLSQQIGYNNQQIKTVVTNFEGFANQFIVKMDMSKSDFIDIIQNNNDKFNTEYKNVSAMIIKGIIQQTEINKQGIEMLISNVQQFNQDVNNIKNEISQLRQRMEKQINTN
jgi:methyl-accepting chemotaxis protein